jgi:2-methylcitrate dehydratase PrpD
MAASVRGRTEITRELARFASTTTLAGIPAETQDTYKAVFLDTLGCIIAARRTDLAERLSRSVQAFGTGRCSLVGRPEGVSGPAAAIYNGAASHSLNYSAIGPGNSHLGAVLCGGVLAAAEEHQASGARLLSAMTVAGEVAARLAECVWQSPEAPKVRAKWLLGQTLGYVGVAAGCANVLGLDEKQTHSALGLAVMQAAGTTEVMRLGDVPGKSVYAGFANLGGYLSAQMAASGIEADYTAVEGEFGLLRMIGVPGPFDTFADLGSSFHSSVLHLKRWPLSINAERYVAALDSLGPATRAARDIKSVVLTVLAADRQWLEPVEGRRRPANQSAAANSIQFAVATFLMRGTVPVGPAADEVLGDESVRALADRVSYAVDPSERGIRIEYGDGSAVTVPVPDLQPVAVAPGDVMDKLARCAAAGAAPEDGWRMADAGQAVSNLAELDDCRDVVAALRFVA